MAPENNYFMLGPGTKPTTARISFCHCLRMGLAIIALLHKFCYIVANNALIWIRKEGRGYAFDAQVSP